MVQYMARALQGLSVGLVGLLLLGLLVPAQAQGPDVIGLDELEKQVGKRENRDLIPKLLRGDVAADPSNPTHVEALNVEARSNLFRFDYDVYYDPNKSGKNIERLYRDFDTNLTLLTRTPARTKATWPLYTQALITQGKFVLQSRRNIARINAARCLARLPELQQPELFDLYLGQLQDDSQIDAVKYYMLRGLTDLLAIEKEEPLLKKEAVEKAARWLTEFVQKQAQFPAGTSQQEIRGYQVMRREAIRALGNTRLPSLDAKTQPALVALKIMAGQGVEPAPLMDERIEAAIALARMKPEADKNFCPDYAVQQISAFLTRTFASFALADNRQARLPCKIYAARLQEALASLATRSANNPDKAAAEYVARVVKSAEPLLKLLQQDSPSGNQVTQRAADLEKAVGAGGPNKQLFRGQADSALQGGN